MDQMLEVAKIAVLRKPQGAYEKRLATFLGDCESFKPVSEEEALLNELVEIMPKIYDTEKQKSIASLPSCCVACRLSQDQGPTLSGSSTSSQNSLIINTLKFLSGNSSRPK